MIFDVLSNHEALRNIFHPLSEHLVQTSSSMNTKGTIGSQGESGYVSCIFAGRGEAAGLFELSKSLILSV